MMLMRAIDANHDGELSRKEIEGAARAIIEALDKDGDKMISKAELTPKRPERPEGKEGDRPKRGEGEEGKRPPRRRGEGGEGKRPPRRGGDGEGGGRNRPDSE